MKKILLATTLLAASTGVAMADAHMSWGADAAAGIADFTGTGFAPYSSAGLSMDLAGSTDGGLTFGTSFSLTTGTSFDIDDGFAAESGAFGGATAFIDGSFGKLEFSDAGFDFAEDTTTGDVQYTGKFGMFGVGLIADIDTGAMQLGGDFAVGPISVAATADSEEFMDVKATYKVSETISAFVSTNEASESHVGADLALGSISVGVDMDIEAEAADLSLGYSANALSVDFSTNTGDSSYNVTIGYDLGGGLALTAATNDLDTIQVGATMAF